MAAQDYDWSMTKVFVEEGGYGWDKGDPGGPTKYGITCYDLAEYLGQAMTSMADWAPKVKAMTKQTAEDIYSKKYRTKDRFDDLNPGLDIVILDYGINSGTKRPIVVAQRILGIKADGIFGPITLSHINSANPKEFIDFVCDERLDFMKHIRNGEAWAEFGKGWGARVSRMRSYGMSLSQHNGPPPTTLLAPLTDFIPHRSPKAYDDDHLKAIHHAASLGTRPEH